MEASKADLPLNGIRVLVTRERSQAPELSSALAAQGAISVECPTIMFASPDDWSQVDSALEALDRYEMLLFTSSNAVRFFMERAKEKNIRPEKMSCLTIFAIGPATANEATSYGLCVEPLAEQYLAEGLLEMLKAEGLRGKRILFPRALVARELLPDQLRAQGAAVDIVTVYKTQEPLESRQRLIELLEARAVDLVTFTSSSTAKNFVEMVGKSRLPLLLSGIPVACIGEITADNARRQGLEVHIVPKEHTIQALVLAIVAFYGQTSKGEPTGTRTVRGSICRIQKND